MRIFYVRSRCWWVSLSRRLTPLTGRASHNHSDGLLLCVVRLYHTDFLPNYHLTYSSITKIDKLITSVQSLPLNTPLTPNSSKNMNGSAYSEYTFAPLAPRDLLSPYLMTGVMVAECGRISVGEGQTCPRVTAIAIFFCAGASAAGTGDNRASGYNAKNNG